MRQDPRPRVLLVDHDAREARCTAARLEQGGLEVRWSLNPEDAVVALNDFWPDVMLLESRMPGTDGLELCRRLRDLGYRRALLVYSAEDTPLDVVLAHDAGADDHVSKRADFVVLQAKIRRAVQRTRDREATPKPESPGLTARHQERPPSAWPADPCALTRLEGNLLAHLERAQGTIVSRDSLLVAGWGRAAIAPGLLYDALSHLRSKLGALGWNIENIRGEGYRLVRTPGPGPVPRGTLGPRVEEKTEISPTESRRNPS